MPEIVFIHPTGAVQAVEAALGQSVMRAAMLNDVEGILAECGGAAACATCHVFVTPVPGLPPRSALEDDMLDATAVPSTAESRLSCQIFVTAELAGLQVRLPEAQV